MDLITNRKEKIVPYKNEYRNSFINLYQKVFNRPPWNENWDKEKVERIITSLTIKKGVIGLVTKKDKNPIGFLFAYPFAPLFSFMKLYYLGELFIDQTFHGRGLGKTLCLHFFDEAYKQGGKRSQANLLGQGGKRIILLTKKDSPAEKFYNKLEFKVFSSFFKIKGKIIMYKKLYNIQEQGNINV